MKKQLLLITLMAVATLSINGSVGSTLAKTSLQMTGVAITSIASVELAQIAKDFYKKMLADSYQAGFDAAQALIAELPVLAEAPKATIDHSAIKITCLLGACVGATYYLTKKTSSTESAKTELGDTVIAETAQIAVDLHKDTLDMAYTESYQFIKAMLYQAVVESSPLRKACIIATCAGAYIWTKKLTASMPTTKKEESKK